MGGKGKGGDEEVEVMTGDWIGTMGYQLHVCFLKKTD